MSEAPLVPNLTDGCVGVIGLGMIGRGVAATLVRHGRSVAIYDVRADAADDLPGLPSLSASPKQVAERASVIFLCVVDAAQIRDLMSGPYGVFAARRSDLALVVMSTISLADLSELRERASLHAAHVLDAGVTGGPAAALAGELVVFVGGDEPIVQATLPVVRDTCAHVVRAGGPGTGMAAKLARNVVSYGCFRAAYEGALLAERSGVDLHEFAAAIRASDQQSGGCTVFIDRRGTAEPMDEHESRGAAEHVARLAVKDLSAAAELAADLGVDLPLAKLTAARFPEVVGLHPT